ncbi:radical SAM protein [Fervidicoccus fontis]|uniref:Pyruvate formate lyase-activating protein n=1 Tax=Fervidicoccus fontis TaxID=683846 RepID=A0A2J6N3V8_9CREN|nr:radical SAM protein [Fervidicoccus fontis]MBE9390927.1 radical SAM protein [Fervidicoccus fontis]PMB76005.1 MAG: pyruvate formate lyase-activating protein [Fervidicoccus fontis]PMB77129.1 MAG: pyruvate formate lyase-activating protein [Fervidicoccus fontis]HEW64326.1 radical SAM protein [Fervidicoccus fontis]
MNSRIERALSWYYGILRGRYPPKYKIARSLEVDVKLTSLSLQELWSLHEEFEKEFHKLSNDIMKDESIELRDSSNNSYLDLKIEILKRMLTNCEYCERKCGSNRLTDKGKFCKVDYKTYISSYFLHYGEEYPLVPSGTIFYSGCNLRCVYCQNYEISQSFPLKGKVVAPQQLAAIQDKLVKEGAKNINHVGGEPTPYTHAIVESFKYLKTNTPQIWNSNFYMSEKLTILLRDLIDLWLPDFKYWDDSHAIVLSAAPRYREAVIRNLLLIENEGSIILRHLVLPNHVKCCSIPIIEWLSKNMPKDWLVVNIMDQYYPTYRVLSESERWRDLNRKVRKDEYFEVVDYAAKEDLILI